MRTNNTLARSWTGSVGIGTKKATVRTAMERLSFPIIGDRGERRVEFSYSTDFLRSTAEQAFCCRTSHPQTDYVFHYRTTIDKLMNS